MGNRNDSPMAEVARGNITFELVGAPAWVEKAWRRNTAPIVHVPRHRVSRPQPRGRRFRRVRRVSASSRGSPDDDPEPAGGGLQRLQRLRVISPAEFRQAVDRTLGAAWVDLSEELVEHVERQAKIEDAAGGGPFASGGAA